MSRPQFPFIPFVCVCGILLGAHVLYGWCSERLIYVNMDKMLQLGGFILFVLIFIWLKSLSKHAKKITAGKTIIITLENKMYDRIALASLFERVAPFPLQKMNVSHNYEGRIRLPELLGLIGSGAAIKSFEVFSPNTAKDDTFTFRLLSRDQGEGVPRVIEYGKKYHRLIDTMADKAIRFSLNPKQKIHFVFEMEHEIPDHLLRNE